MYDSAMRKVAVIDFQGIYSCLGGTSARWLCWVLGMFLVICQVLGSASLANPRKNPEVLILNSYHPGFSWSTAEESGFLQRLREVYPKLEIPMEFLDAKRNAGEKNLWRVKDFLKDKYRGKKLDLIVAFDNSALNMLIRHRHELFPQVPVVFAGINNIQQYQPASLRGMTGVAEVPDVKQTLELALALHPRTKEILTVHDYTVSGLGARRDTEPLAQAYADRVRISFIPPSSFEEVKNRISSLPKDALVLLEPFATDRLGESLPLAESAMLFTSAALVPVYGVHETRLGYGIVGGYLLGGKEHGRRAADIALRVLAGEAPGTIPVDTTSTARPMFDYLQLQKFGISLRNLPANSTIINKPESILDKYKDVVIGTLVILAFLVVMVISLVVANIRRKQAEEDLHRETEKYRILTEESPVGVALIGEDGNYKYINPKFTEIFGYTLADIPTGQEWFTKAYPKAEDRQEAISFWVNDLQKSRVGESRPRTFRVTCKDGALKIINFRPVTLEKGDQLVIYEDVTGLALANEALQEREETLSVLINSNPESLLLLDTQGTVLAANATVAERMGKKLAEIQGSNIWDLLPSEVVPSRKAHIAEVVATGKPIQFEDMRLGRYIANYCHPVLDFQGRVSRIAVLGVDLTEYKEAEKLLRESEQRYRQLVNQIPAVVYKGYLDWSLECFDQKIEEITGYSMEEFNTRQKTWLDLIFPEDVGRAKKLLLEARKGDDSYVTEHRINKKNGEVRWVQSRNRIIYNSQGKIDHVSGVFFDITDHKNLEEERDRLFNLSMDLLCVAGFDGVFKQLNPAWSKTLGWPETELLSRPWLDFVHPEDRMATAAAGEQLQAGQPVIQFENRYQCRDGSYRWISWNSFPLLEEKLIFAVARDITEKRHMEEHLFKSQKMEAVGRLAGGVAHDFNNLLTAIMGYSEMMMMSLRKEDPFYSYTEEIVKAANRGASLTNQLLAFGRKQILQPRVINLNDVVMDMDKMLRRLIGEDVELVTAIDHELGAVKADPGQIAQIVMNLAVNARDAMPQGGNLTIETANVYLNHNYARSHEGVSPGPHVMLAVSDNGTGMDAETFSHIFEPFFTTKESGEGTGLGLATVYGIVKQSGGNIWVYSEPGQGTTFKVYLPRVEESLEIVKPQPAPVTALEGNETILLVEDDAGVRELISKGLRNYGFTVLEASQRDEALLLCEREKNPINLLLTDVVLPKLSGSALAKQLKLQHPEMKVLFMSGYTENAIVHHGVLDAKVNFIPKPFRVQTLVQKVREVLDSDVPS